MYIILSINTSKVPQISWSFRVILYDFEKKSSHLYNLLWSITLYMRACICVHGYEHRCVHGCVRVCIICTTVYVRACVCITCSMYLITCTIYLTTHTYMYTSNTTWIIRHGLVYFGPFSVGLFSSGPVFGKCPKTENKPWAYFWCLRFFKNVGCFPKISPELILGKPRYSLCLSHVIFFNSSSTRDTFWS